MCTVLFPSLRQPWAIIYHLKNQRMICVPDWQKIASRMSLELFECRYQTGRIGSAIFDNIGRWQLI